MNKLEGFFELQRSGLPTVPWQQFMADTELSGDILWTVRCAVTQGDDLNLPRRVGVQAAEAMAFARQVLQELGPQSLVIYYPYFVAEKSGVLEVTLQKTVIEAVRGDLWNLVSENKLDVSICIAEAVTVTGDSPLLSAGEIDELVGYAQRVRTRYRDDLLSGKSLFLEWSHACQYDLQRQTSSGSELIFYELRSVD